MLIPDKIVWQIVDIYQSGPAFEILLDRSFAKEMLETKIGSKHQRRMNELAEETLEDLDYSRPHYLFHEDTAFVRQINLDAGRGTWLVIAGQQGRIPDFSKKEPLQYITHNIDSYYDTIGLLKMFDRWVANADTLKKLK